MLQIIRNNLFHGSKDLRLFEFGKAYFRDVSSREGSPVPGYTEENRLIIACSGVASPPAWDTPARSADLYDLKGELETLFRKILLDNIKFIPYPTTNALTEMGLLIEIHGVIAGEIGRVHKGLMTRFEVEQEVFFAEVNTDLLLEKISSRRTFKPLGKYPLVTRDVAFVVDENLAVGDIEESIREAGGSLLRRLELFDTYRGNQIHSGKKSLAFALEFLSEDHTLTQEEIDRVMHNIITAVSKKFDGVLRG
jgi:phenylalanyl-tRNA synthetase beta chain